jgi:hypothetical protein
MDSGDCACKPAPKIAIIGNSVLPFVTGSTRPGGNPAPEMAILWLSAPEEGAYKYKDSQNFPSNQSVIASSVSSPRSQLDKSIAAVFSNEI